MNSEDSARTDGFAARADAMDRLFTRDYTRDIYSIKAMDFAGTALLNALITPPPQRIVLRGRTPKHRIADPVKKAARLRQGKARARSRSRSK